MAAAGEDEQPLPAFVQFVKRFPGAFLSLESVQKVLHSLQAAEGKSLSSAESFVDLLQPSPTMHQILEKFSLSSDGGGKDELKITDGDNGGDTLQGVLWRLDKALGEVELKEKENPGALVEARLREFEEEIGLPEEERGKLNKLISSQDVTVEAVVMFLASHFDVAAPEPSKPGTSTG
ncbi:hypothetical protein QQ045_016538 [Rhodiola kirilowii]